MDETFLAELDEYFALGFAEGKEGREHDTPDGDAQRVRSSLEARYRALLDEIEKLRAANEWWPMSSAPTDGTPFLAIRKWPSGIESGTYRWEGEPNYWHDKRRNVCIRPDYQTEYLWRELPDDFVSTPEASS